MVRRLLLLLAVCLILGIAFLWVRVIEPSQRHMAFYRATRAEFESLAKKQPANVTRKQWQHVVAWTLNAHGNCISFTPHIPQEDRDQFLADLQCRLKGEVDLTTVDWIWDELVRLTPNGQRYSDLWRPTTPKRLQEFEESNISWVGTVVE